LKSFHGFNLLIKLKLTKSAGFYFFEQNNPSQVFKICKVGNILGVSEVAVDSNLLYAFSICNMNKENIKFPNPQKSTLINTVT
jgi:hypothetical protein